MTTWRMAKMTKWRNDEMPKWQNDNMTEWQNDKMAKWRHNEWQKWQNDETTKGQNEKMTTWRNGKTTRDLRAPTGLKSRKSASHPQAGLGRLVQRPKNGAKHSSSIWGCFNLAGWGRCWHFWTCNGGSKFWTLISNSMASTGPVAKFQSPRILMFIRLSISTLKFASGAPGIQQPGQFLTILEWNMVIFQSFQDCARIIQGVSGDHLEVIWRS